MERLGKLALLLLRMFIVAAMTAMIVLVFLNVVLRYGFNSGISISEELSRTLFVWLSFTGAVLAMYDHGHLGVDSLVRRMPRGGQVACAILCDALMLFCAGLLMIGSWKQVVINWDNFSIGAGQGVDFRQPGARSIALNRVTGPEISQIMGELTANGQIYLINGNGIVFGKDARVDVAGLVATSADIANDTFMGGGALRFGTPGRAGAKVTNHGTITVRDAGIAARCLGNRVARL